MRGSSKLVNPDEMEMELTLSTTLKEWKELRSQLLGGSWPSCRLHTIIGELVRQAEAHFIVAKETP